MVMKQIAAVMLIMSFVCNAAPVRVKGNSIKQAQGLIKQYDKAKTVEEKERKAAKMRELLNTLNRQNAIFGGAVKDQEMSGELTASIVNEEEQVSIQKTIDLLKNKLAEVDSGMPVAQN